VRAGQRPRHTPVRATSRRQTVRHAARPIPFSCEMAINRTRLIDTIEAPAVFSSLGSHDGGATFLGYFSKSAILQALHLCR
jgi:hypothetical protein